jgi:hypothetical protein
LLQFQRPLDVVGVFADDGDIAVTTVERWLHPGVAQLTLPALCVEANVHRVTSGLPAWTMPAMAVEISAALASVGVTTTAMLRERSSSDADVAALVHALRGTSRGRPLLDAADIAHMSALFSLDR